VTNPVHPDLAPLVATRPVVLVFVPDRISLERFVLSGALEQIGEDRRLHYVLPRHGAEAIAAAAGSVLTPGNASTISVAVADVMDLINELEPVFAVIPTAMDDPLCTAAMEAARQAPLATLFLQGDRLDLSAGVRPLPEASFLAAWGPEEAAQAVETHGFNRKCVVTLGAPRDGAPGAYAARLAEFCRWRLEVRGHKLRAQRTGVRRHSISHVYGAHLVAQQYCGATDVPPIPGYWMHGWLPAYHNVHPAFIAQHKRGGQGEGYDFATQLARDKAEVPQWVARPDQAAYLTAHGYVQTTAIGLPIVYVPPPAVARVPGSLLVMPPHSHRSHGPDDHLAEAYADAILSIRGRFEHVWIGVSEDDITDRQWVDAFRRRGLPVFMTTDPGDPQTLVRLRRILSTFEYVTTNGFGTHIAMAAYCGARTSVFGPFAEFPRERMQGTHAVKMNPALLETAWALCTEEVLRRHYPSLFVTPDRAPLAQEWGAQEVGEPCRQSPAGLRQLFGWSAA
jgi:hypothetical protein